MPSQQAFFFLQAQVTEKFKYAPSHTANKHHMCSLCLNYRCLETLFLNCVLPEMNGLIKEPISSEMIIYFPKNIITEVSEWYF